MWYSWQDPELLARKESAGGGHSCESETSFVLGTHPELVRMSEHCGDGTSRRAFELAAGVSTPAQGRANFPDHYVGDALPATREKGDWLVARAVQKVAAVIAAVKADTKTMEFMKRFHGEAAHPV